MPASHPASLRGAFLTPTSEWNFEIACATGVQRLINILSRFLASTW